MWPIPVPTVAPSVQNDTVGGLLRIGISDDEDNTNTTSGGGISDGEKVTMIVLLTVGGMIFVTGILALYLHRLTKKRKKNTNNNNLQIEIPVSPEIIIEWPTRRYRECTPQIMKRRSNTYPRERIDSLGSSSSSPQRPRLLSGVSLGEISRGGEPYGDEVEVLIDSTNTPS